jgi:predicted amidohydrolase YtcJ
VLGIFGRADWTRFTIQIHAILIVCGRDSFYREWIWLQSDRAADTILLNGKIATQDSRRSFASGLAIRGDRFVAVGSDGEALEHKGPDTVVIDLKGRTVVPGLNDSHLHMIRGGRSYNAEVRWDGLPSLEEGLRLVSEQVRRTPSPHWVRVVGGWSEFQFKERRMPTLDEINRLAPSTPVFLLNLYHVAMLNKKALSDAGYTGETPNPPGGEIQKDEDGEPNGMLIAKPNAAILYSTLDKAPKLSHDDQLDSTRQFMHELNRLGITSVIDAGGGYQTYPDDYAVIQELAQSGLVTVRTSYNLFTQRPGHELEDYTNWSRALVPGSGDSYYRLNGAGEMLVYSGADFEDFPEPRPELPPSMEEELTKVVSILAEKRWPFRLHATYGESIDRFLDVFEAVNEKMPFDGLRWFFDHAETISSKSIRRVKKLGGGIAIQDRMAFQGEYFAERYGDDAAKNAPPIIDIMEAGITIGAGTDATRVASYNPWVALYWLVSGKTVGGLELSQRNRLDRVEALRLWTLGSAWFSGEQGQKGSIEVGKLADLAVLSHDYFEVVEKEIMNIESVLTLVGGRVVHADGEFAKLGPSPLPVSPAWSPVAANR